MKANEFGIFKNDRIWLSSLTCFIIPQIDCLVMNNYCAHNL